MTLGLMLVNDNDIHYVPNTVLSIHYVPDTMLCALYVIYLIFTTTLGTRNGYSMFTEEETEVNRGDRDNSSMWLTRGRMVINNTSSTISRTRSLVMKGC